MTDEGTAARGPDTSAPPVLRVVRGNPTAEELAAVVAVLSASAGAAPSTGAGDQPRTTSWNDPHRAVRAPLSPGPRAWRSSALPS